MQPIKPNTKHTISKIMKKTLQTSLGILLPALLMTGCQKQQFHVEGSITNAKDSVLYFENLSLEGPVTLDSIRLD